MTADFKRKLPVVGAFQLKYIVDVDRYNILKTGQEKILSSFKIHKLYT